MATPLSPECRLVFRSADPSAPHEELHALAREVRDWPLLQLLAEREGAVSALSGALRGAPGLLPDALVEPLRRSAMVSDFRMQQLAQRLRETVAALSARRIPVQLLKGAAVGALVDPTFRARPMGDLDLLVRAEDAERAEVAARDAGWIPTPDAVARELLRDAHHLPPFLDPVLSGVRLELHVALFPRDHSFAFDESTLWAEGAPCAAFDGAHVATPEALALHACAHFAWQHAVTFGPWRTFRSLGLLAAHPAFDWTRFVARARTARLGTSVYWTLRLARRLALLRVPDAALAALAPPTAGWLCDAIERHFISQLVPGEGVPSPSVRLSQFLWRVAMRPAWSGHRTARRWDDAWRWDEARGTRRDESLSARVLRQARDHREWWRYLRRTLSP